jgi:hypothetical protein
MYDMPRECDETAPSGAIAVRSRFNSSYMVERCVSDRDVPSAGVPKGLDELSVSASEQLGILSGTSATSFGLQSGCKTASVRDAAK